MIQKLNTYFHPPDFTVNMESNNVNIDKKDLKILNHVESDGKENIEALAEDLELSVSTIYYRIDRLKQQGIINDVTVDVNPLALGFDMVMITQVFVIHEPGYAENIGDSLGEIPGVQQVYYTMGNVDFVVISRTRDRDDMNRIINDIVNIDGVNETSSIFVMDEIKNTTNITDSISGETLSEIVGSSEQ